MTNGNHQLDQGVVCQAFSHMSRMHGSSAAAFFASVFGYIAYLAVYAREIHHRTNNDLSTQIVLLAAPLIIPCYLLLKHYVTCAAFRRVAEDIRASPQLTLYEYLWDIDNGIHRGVAARFWLHITQRTIRMRSNTAYWFSIFFFLAVSAAFAYRLWEVLLRK